MFRKVFKLILLMTIVEIVSCLKCHVCNSKMSPACLDPFNKTSPLTQLQECDAGPQQRFDNGGYVRNLDVVDMIMHSGGESGNGGENTQTSQSPDGKDTMKDVGYEMVCQKIVVIVGNESITGRGCSPQSVDGVHPCDAVRLLVPEHVCHCITCTTDACNAASVDVQSPRLLSALSIPLILFFCTRF